MTGSGAAARILVVDDEHAIVRALGAALEARGYRVDVARDGHEALEKAAGTTPDLIILDLGLPDLDGIEVCRKVRAWSDVPIVVLTAEGSDEAKVSALDEGADDYVTKPFSTPELLARVRVALRHAESRRGHDAPDEARYEVGSLVVDLPHHEVRVGDTKLDLTPKEFGFLAVLAKHPGRVLTHRMILQEVWGEGYGTETQYLRVYASQLRKKLAGLGAPDLVTEPGVGYRLVQAEGQGS